jgi:hypothetical protein
MPTVVHHAIDVEAAPEACWKVFADLGRWPDWFPMCKSARPLNGAPWRLGGRIEIVFHAGPVGVPVIVEVEELAPAKRVRWVGGRLGMSGNHSYDFDVNRTGLTRVTSHEAFSGLYARWIPRTLFDRIDLEVHRSMERFKTLVEAASAT